MIVSKNNTGKVFLKDIAQAAGVSVAVASFVLNGKGKEHRISNSTIAKVMDIAKSLNYVPNLAARTLRAGKSNIIGVVLPDISNAFFSQVARKIEDVTAEYGYVVLFGSSDENSAKMKKTVESLINLGVAGLIVAPCENSADFMRALVESGTPMVQFDRPYFEIDSSYVALDNHASSYKAVSHILNSGFRSPGMLAYEMDLSHMRDRIRGYADAVSDSGGQPAVSYLNPDSVVHSAAKAIASMLDKGIDSFFCATNTISIAALYAFSELDIGIPDVGLVGFDGSEAFDLFRTPLSYVKQPVDFLARKAVEIVVGIIENGADMAQKVQAEGSLVVQASSR